MKWLFVLSYGNNVLFGGKKKETQPLDVVCDPEL